ncbi:MAG: prophage regulatory protein [Brevundimonas sp.]|jgi:prophage regulatory protein|uniref:helix-turn-helix transcriptional regulator n=1 Tax=Brevundimonas sp. TaxID=1871086 RepID=UPI0039E65674
MLTDVLPPPEPAPERLLLWPQVREIVGVSRTTAWRMQRNGLFPDPVQVSPNRVAWRKTDIDAWCQERTRRSSRSVFLMRRPARKPPPPPAAERLQPPQLRQRTCRSEATPPQFQPLFEHAVFATRPLRPFRLVPPPAPLPPRRRTSGPSGQRKRRPRGPAVAEGQIAFDF